MAAFLVAFFAGAFFAAFFATFLTAFFAAFFLATCKSSVQETCVTVFAVGTPGYASRQDTSHHSNPFDLSTLTSRVS